MMVIGAGEVGKDATGEGYFSFLLKNPSNLGRVGE